MKKYYEDNKDRLQKERNLRQNNKEFNNSKEENLYKKGKSTIKNNNNYNYLHQTLSSKNKIKKSKSSDKNKQKNQNKTKYNNRYNNKIISHNNLKNGQINKEMINNNLEDEELQNRISTISLNNNSSDINNINNNNDKNLYHTMQNFYMNYPKPEPAPIRINYSKTKNNNNSNVENENIMNNIQEDKNILYLLSNLNLENLYNIFVENYISFNDLFLLTKGDFAEMKIPIGPRNRILHFIYEYKKFGKNFDFKELSSFLVYYKKIINKPLMNDINNNELVISTNNISNGPFNCFNSSIINNFVNNQKNDEIYMEKENIEKINIFPININNKQKINSKKELENDKEDSNRNYNISKDINNSTKFFINSKDKKYSNTTNTKLKKNNSHNSSKKNLISNSSIKKFVFSENNKNSHASKHTNYLNSKNKNNNIKTLSSKNLKNNFNKDENSKIHERNNNMYYKMNFIKRGYNKNILLKNCNNSNYLLEKFKNIDKEVIKFQKNYSKIQKSARNFNRRLSNIFFLQKNSQINDNLYTFMESDFEKENIRNLNYELNHNYQKKY